MSRDPALRLEDILEAASSIEVYAKGMDFEAFIKDRRTVDAITRNLEIIGEAAKHLPEEMIDRHPEIPWKAIMGFRDILAHGYFRTDDAIIWDAATNHNQPLIEAVRDLLG